MQLGDLFTHSQSISMKLPSSYLNKFTSGILKRKEQADAFKKLAQRGDWKDMVKRCHDKLTEEYRFWISKAQSSTRTAKLTDLNKDIAFIKLIEDKPKIDEIQLKKLKELVSKYNL